MINQAKILIVDDIKANRDVLSDMIEMLGHIPVLAENGLLALSTMKDQLPDLVLLDILMPKMNGYEVLDHMKENSALRYIPVIMISAIDDIDSVVKCIEKGADDYLTKPFNSTLLKARINACLEKKQLRDQEQRLHAELSRSYDALKSTEQARDSMSHMIVHDMNNLVAIVMGNIQLMQCSVSEDDIDKDELADNLQVTRNSTEEMAFLIQSILDVSKLESGTMPVTITAIDASQTLKNLYEQYIHQIKNKGLHLSLKTGADDLIVNADRMLLLRTMQNLLTNALKHTEKETNVTISAKKDNQNIVFSVTDNGPGIPEEYRDRIFEKFFQIETGSRRKRYGVGLGLAFCKMATEAQGGKIWVECHDGKGAEFKVSLAAVNS